MGTSGSGDMLWLFPNNEVGAQAQTATVE